VILSCVVDPYRSGWTLGEFLAHRFRYHPPHIWSERIAAGVVRVGDAAATDATPVHAGDRITYTIVHEEPPVDFAFSILHEDADCLAVAKSGNIPMHTGGRYIRNTLIAHLRAVHSPELVLTHRLDRETSGVVLLAKHRDAARHFEREFHGGRVRKTYLAVLRGIARDAFVVDAPIGRAPATDPDPPRWRVVEPPLGKASVTQFRRLAVGRAVRAVADPPGVPPANDSVSLVEAVPLSGRTNQIRIHAAHAGHPVLGDKAHAVAPSLARAFLERGTFDELVAAAGAPRHLLHAAALVVAHPCGSGVLELSAPTPPDFALSSSDLFPEDAVP
jgi:23S rRNA pseudouridine1911/1915/1917 synthase